MPDPYFPFHALGYRCNPFRAVTDDEWTALALPPPALEAAVAQGFAHLQVIGEKGHGKTSALLWLKRHFSRAGARVAYEHLEVDQTHFYTPLALDVFLLDEAQRLAPAEESRLLAALSGGHASIRAVLGTHSDHSAQFARRGLPLATLHLETLPLSHVEAVIARRLGYFSLNPDRSGPAPTPQAIGLLHRRFGADLRKIEMALYEIYQRIAGGAGVTEIGEEVVERVVFP